MLVGEAPGETEEAKGRPFIGPAGQLLDEALREAGIRRSDVYITNVVKCRPPMNRDPRKEEQNACMIYLADECEQVQPDVILCLGASATKALTGASSLASSRGEKLTTRRELGINIPVYSTYHPAAASRDGGRRSRMFKALVDDLRRVYRYEDDINRPNHRRALFQPGDERATLALSRLQSAETLAVDLEWLAAPGEKEMMWPWHPDGKALSISLSARIGEEILSAGIGLPATTEAMSALSRLLTSARVVAHNGTSDSLWLRGIGLPHRIDGDTMLQAHAVNEEQKLALESLANRYCNIPEWKTPLWTSPPVNTQEWDALLRYNTDDTYATLLLWEALRQEATEADRRVHDLIMIPAMKVLTNAAWVGVPIDRADLMRNFTRTMERKREHIVNLACLTGLTERDAEGLASSPDRTKRLLGEAYGMELENAQKSTLNEISSESPAVNEILGIKTQNKLVSTYLTPWNELLARQGDGRLHTVYRIHGTRTGRLSAEIERGGSLQVTPKEKWVRQLVRAPEGRRIVAADYSQVELRVIAWLANERNMLQLFHERVDLHSATAAFMLARGEAGLTLDQFWRDRDRWIARIDKESPQRQAAKAINFGLVFGMQPEGFQNYSRINYGVHFTFEEAEEAHRQYFELYPRLQPWHQEQVHAASRTGFVHTPFGRKRYVGQELTKAVNFPVQSTASDLTVLAMASIHGQVEDEGLDADVIGFVHDSVLLEASEDHVDAVTRIVEDVMPNVDTSAFGFTIDVPLPIDVSVGQSWG